MSEFCPAKECGARGGHHPLCPLSPAEYKARQLEWYYRHVLEQCVTIGRLRRLVTEWQGKHAILKAENNKLRKRLRQLEVDSRCNNRGTTG
jgi:hypothetical protein